MNTLELKTNFHQLIDNINNELMLSKFYSIMTKINETPEGALWSRLTKEEQEELMEADMESENQANLIPHSEIQKKHKKWL